MPNRSDFRKAQKKGMSADDNEIMIFYNKYIKTLKLVVDEDGNFSIEVK